MNISTEKKKKYWKSKKKKNKTINGNSYGSDFLFCHTGVIFFVILYFAEIENIYICKVYKEKKGVALIKEKKVQVYCIGDKNKDL